jgi:hypothetical protein
VDVFQKPNGQHSLLELLWHIITWREFTLSRLQPSAEKNSRYFEQQDWRTLDETNKNLWHEGLKKLERFANELGRRAAAAKRQPAGANRTGAYVQLPHVVVWHCTARYLPPWANRLHH